MKHNRILIAAAWLWVFAVLTAAPLVSSMTQAKYVAGAEAAASARVASWDAFERIDPEDDDKTGEPVLLLYRQGDAGQTATLTLVNKSEVTARYVLVPNVDDWDTVAYPDKEDFLEALGIRISTTCDTLTDDPCDECCADRYAGQTYSAGDGIVLGYADGAPTVAHLDVTIPAVAFKGLRIEAYATQVD